MKHTLTAAERVRILTGRVDNLSSGSGSYYPRHRAIALAEAEDALRHAQADLEKESAVNPEG